jgi:hypothetical protein
VVVVNVEAPDATISESRLGSAADRAAAVLGGKTLGVLLGRQSVAPEVPVSVCDAIAVAVSFPVRLDMILIGRVPPAENGPNAVGVSSPVGGIGAALLD